MSEKLAPSSSNTPTPGEKLTALPDISTLRNVEWTGYYDPKLAGEVKSEHLAEAGRHGRRALENPTAGEPITGVEEGGFSDTSIGEVVFKGDIEKLKSTLSPENLEKFTEYEEHINADKVRIAELKGRDLSDDEKAELETKKQSVGRFYSFVAKQMTPEISAINLSEIRGMSRQADRFIKIYGRDLSRYNTTGGIFSPGYLGRVDKHAEIEGFNQELFDEDKRTRLEAFTAGIMSETNVNEIAEKARSLMASKGIGIDAAVVSEVDQFFASPEANELVRNSHLEWVLLEEDEWEDFMDSVANKMGAEVKSKIDSPAEDDAENSIDDLENEKMSFAEACSKARDLYFSPKNLSAWTNRALYLRSLEKYKTRTNHDIAKYVIEEFSRTSLVHEVVLKTLHSSAENFSEVLDFNDSLESDAINYITLILMPLEKPVDDSPEGDGDAGSEEGDTSAVPIAAPVAPAAETLVAAPKVTTTKAKLVPVYKELRADRAATIDSAPDVKAKGKEYAKLKPKTADGKSYDRALRDKTLTRDERIALLEEYINKLDARIAAGSELSDARDKLHNVKLRRPSKIGKVVSAFAVTPIEAAATVYRRNHPEVLSQDDIDMITGDLRRDTDRINAINKAAEERRERKRVRKAGNAVVGRVMTGVSSTPSRQGGRFNRFIGNMVPTEPEN